LDDFQLESLLLSRLLKKWVEKAICNCRCKASKHEVIEIFEVEILRASSSDALRMTILPFSAACYSAEQIPFH
jgi:hypothetical protein